MVIQHNIAAMNVHRNMMLQNNEVCKRLERLSSGMRINRAADNAAGLAISEKMRSQIRGLDMARLNTLNSISMWQTAEGGMNEIHDITQRMRELAVQSANGTYSDADRALLAKEFEALKEEITRISKSTNYNGIKLLDGSTGALKGDEAAEQLGFLGLDVENMQNDILSLDFRVDVDGSGYATLETSDGVVYREKFDADGNSVSFDLGDGKTVTLNIDTDKIKTGTIKNIGINGQIPDASQALSAGENNALVFQIGANGSVGQQVKARVDNMASYALGDPEKGKSLQDININTRKDAQDAIGVLDKAINQISSARAGVGAQINRLQHSINNIETQAENLLASESRIRDADMAEEMMEFVKHNILLQAAQAMMAQAMHRPESILQLLKQ